MPARQANAGFLHIGTSSLFLVIRRSAQLRSSGAYFVPASARCVILFESGNECRRFSRVVAFNDCPSEPSAAIVVRAERTSPTLLAGGQRIPPSMRFWLFSAGSIRRSGNEVALDTTRLTGLLQGGAALAEWLGLCEEVWIPLIVLGELKAGFCRHAAELQRRSAAEATR